MSRPQPPQFLSNLHIPPSPHTVSVTLLQTGTIRNVPTSDFFSPPIPGHETLAAPVFSFLIQHPSPTGGPPQRLLFDLGTRHDWRHLAPPVLHTLTTTAYHPHTPTSLPTLLSSHGIPPSSITALLWSHPHFDHTGDPSLFPSSVPLIIGPGYGPILPPSPSSPLLESDLANREVIELDFSPTALKIGPFPAIDHFTNGSLYLLHTPGHAPGHICALARVTSTPDPDSFVLLAGDAFHHPGELRPSKYLPLPDIITPHPFRPLSPRSQQEEGCPRSLFTPLFSRPGGPGGGGGVTEPFYTPSGPWHLDAERARETLRGLAELDGMGNVLVCAAHDETVGEVVGVRREGGAVVLDGFLERGWGREVKWRFLKDFAGAVGGVLEGSVEGTGGWRD
ncbi:hypothetical protein QBC39DRAFT_313773 [Podospora conica]|nr:hypothetical protein QBC39DRAFT_313773 [Schizothecium conicum]